MQQYKTDHTITKHPVDPQRVRTMPAQFGAVDRQLVYQKHIRRMSAEQIALYVFLQCVSDVQGLSFYSDERVCEELNLSHSALCCLLYTSPSPRDRTRSRMPSSA